MAAEPELEMEVDVNPGNEDDNTEHKREGPQSLAATVDVDERTNTKTAVKIPPRITEQQFPSLPRVHPGVCGLRNLGNTCFMDSALQCLAHTTPLREYFIGERKGTSRPFEADINPHNPDGLGGDLATVYANLLEEMCFGSSAVVSPDRFKRQIGHFAPRFAGNHQEDAHELLTFLLDGLHEDLNKISGEKPYVNMTVDQKGKSDKEIAEETWGRHLQRNNSEIVSLFQGQIRCVIKCPDCHKGVKTFEQVMQLNLPIPEVDTVNSMPAHHVGGTDKAHKRSRHQTHDSQVGQATPRSSGYRWPSGFGGLCEKRNSTATLKECLQFFCNEKQAKEENWPCTECGKLVRPVRKVDIWKMPEILIIHLKRFTTSSYGNQKVDTRVNFTQRLSLARYTDNDELKTIGYDLYAVINHSGTLHGGHYTAFVKHDDTWFLCDDSRVEEVHEADVVTGAAYVLFYEVSKLVERSP